MISEHKKVVVAIVALSALFAVFYFWPKEAEVEVVLSNNYLTTPYDIDGEQVVPGTLGTAIYGQPMFSDFNQDGREDVSFVLSRQMDSGEIAYYLVAAFNLEEGYEGMSGIFLGNDLSFEALNQQQNMITVNYKNPQLSALGLLSTNTFMVSSFGLQQVLAQDIPVNTESSTTTPTSETSTEEEVSSEETTE